MMYLMTLDVTGLTPEEYRAVVDRMAVESQPSPDIFLHIATTNDGGLRVIEIWDNEDRFQDFLQNRMVPANRALGIDHKATITVKPLLNFFGPRMNELLGIAPSLPAGPHSRTK